MRVPVFRRVIISRLAARMTSLEVPSPGLTAELRERPSWSLGGEVAMSDRG